jgi:dihydrofolate reductase
LGIPEKYRPLANRLNIVLSNDPAFIATLPKDILIAKSLEDAINLINLDANLSNLVENIMIIGGMQLFEESMFHPLCDAYHLTRINSDFPCDTYLSDRTIQKIKAMQPFSVSEEFHENGLSYRFIKSFQLLYYFLI